MTDHEGNRKIKNLSGSRDSGDFVICIMLGKVSVGRGSRPLYLSAKHRSLYN